MSSILAECGKTSTPVSPDLEGLYHTAVCEHCVAVMTGSIASYEDGSRFLRVPLGKARRPLMNLTGLMGGKSRDSLAYISLPSTRSA